MRTTPLVRKIDRYNDDNAEAALIVLGDPERYPGSMQDWADMVANRLTTANAGCYPELERLWARRAYQRAFEIPDANREHPSIEDQDEVSDLHAWNRR